MNNKDLRMALVLMVIFIVLFGVSFTFKSSGVMVTHTTAAFFPRVVLLVAIFLTLILIFQSIHKGPDRSEKKMDKIVFKRVSLSMVSAVAFGLGVSYIGTLVSITIFIVVIMSVWGVESKRAIIINAVLTPILIYLIFNKMLLVQLPAGIFI